MNRREALQAALAGAAGIAAKGSELTIAQGDELIAFKVTMDFWLSDNDKRVIQEEIRRAFAGTKWENTPCFVLDGGADVQVVKRSDVEIDSDVAVQSVTSLRHQFYEQMRRNS